MRTQRRAWLAALVAACAVAPASARPGDDFNRPDNTAMGPNWTEVVGDWRIQTGRARSQAGFSADLMTFVGFASGNAELTADVDYGGPARVTYAALVSGYAGTTNNVFVKVQDNNADGNFERVFFYYGNNGGAWVGMTGGSFFVDVATFTSARITTDLVGDSVTLSIDRDFNGTPEDVLTRGGLPLVTLGTGVGLGGFNDASIDNFLVDAGVCYPDCNADTFLTVADFGCFQTRFVAGDPYADCNQDTFFTVSDFGCFQTSFVAGCP